MSENDVLTAAIAAWTLVQLTRLGLAARAARHARELKAAKEAGKP